ncbi:hypothetical protein [Sulfuracidifex metallicus]|uniref:hypothetical protein n=1 Tax=Sulfuracidifex metallicus TaxID=47303 RepID=UPI0006D2771A|nr:hypothetical protein [Sulfuracidifex metallicus]
MNGYGFVPTQGDNTQFPILVLNQGNSQGSGVIYVNGVAVETVTVKPLSYQEVELNLPIGKNVITLNGHSFTVNVEKVSNQIQGVVYINGSDGLYETSASPGQYLSFNVTLKYQANNLTSFQSYEDLETNAFFKRSRTTNFLSICYATE